MDAATTVLLVEDDDGFAWLFSRALEGSPTSFDVTHVQFLAEAARQLAARPFHVVVLDLGLPDGTGLPNLAALQSINQDVPVVILTGHSDHELALQAVRQGAQDYITKDFVDSGHLARALTHAVDRKHAETSLRAGVSRLEEAARLDPLTGLLNRRALQQELDSWPSTQQSHDSPAACVMLDIDYFKRVNDSYGHPAGDAALVEVALLLLEEGESFGTACRYGGEEFCVILRGHSESQAAAWANRVREKLLHRPMVTERVTFNVTASFGVAELSGTGHDVDEGLDRADQALLVSKQRGRNRVTVYTAIDHRVELHALSDAQRQPFLSAVACDYMTSPITCLQECDSMLHAADLLLEMGLNSMPVVDQTGELVGIISEKDLIELEPSPDSWNKTVKLVMNSTVVSFAEQTPLETIRVFLARVPMRRIVIVRNKNPVGVVSRSNLLRCYRDWAQRGQATPVECASNAPNGVSRNSSLPI